MIINNKVYYRTGIYKICEFFIILYKNINYIGNRISFMTTL